MANSDKNILIVPNKNSADSNPYISFICADSITGADSATVILELLSNDGGQLRFTNGEAIMHSIAAGIDGVTFRAVDQSGLDDIKITDGEIHLAPNGGHVVIGRNAVQQDSNALVTIAGGLHFIGDSAHFELDLADPTTFNISNKLYNVGGILYFNGSAISISGVDSAYVQLRQSYDYNSLINTPNILDSGNVVQIVIDNSLDSAEAELVAIDAVQSVALTGITIGGTNNANSPFNVIGKNGQNTPVGTFFNPYNQGNQSAVLLAGGDGESNDLLFELRGNTDGPSVNQIDNRSTGDTRFIVTGKGQTWINMPDGLVDSQISGLAGDVYLQVHGKTNLYGNTTVDGNLTVTGDIIADSQATIQVGAGGINFPNDIGGGSGDDAYISLSAIGETQTLTIAVANDADDIINISTPSNSGFKHNNNIVLTDGNFASYYGFFNDVIADTDGTFTAASPNQSLTISAGTGIGVKKTLSGIEIGTVSAGGGALATETYVNGTSLVMALLFG